MRVALVGARAALPGRGDRRPGDPAVRQVPAVEGPRRALGRASRRTRWSPTWCTSRPSRSPTRSATPPPSPTSTSSPPQLPGPGRRLAAARGRRGRRRAHLRARGAARHRQVADHHQPARPGGRRRQAGAVRRREAGGAGRRRPAAGRGRHGPVRPRPARQGQPARPWCGRRSGAALEHAVAVDEQGLAADGEDLRSARADAGPLRRPAARRRTPPGCRSTRRAPRSWPPAPTSPALPVPAAVRAPTRRPTC